MSQWLLHPHLLRSTRTIKPQGKSAVLLFIETYSNCWQHPIYCPQEDNMAYNSALHANTRWLPVAPVRAIKTQWEEGEMFKARKSTCHHTHKKTNTYTVYIYISSFLYLIGKMWYYCLSAAEIKNEDKVSLTFPSALIKALWFGTDCLKWFTRGKNVSFFLQLDCAILKTKMCILCTSLCKTYSLQAEAFSLNNRNIKKNTSRTKS